jgi:hypothetical protein
VSAAGRLRSNVLSSRNASRRHLALQTEYSRGVPIPPTAQTAWCGNHRRSQLAIYTPVLATCTDGRIARPGSPAAIGDYWLAALVTAGAGFANFVGSTGMFARNSPNATVERPSVQVTTQWKGIFTPETSR